MSSTKWRKTKWETQYEGEIAVKDMTDSHLENVVKYALKKWDRKEIMELKKMGVPWAKAFFCVEKEIKYREQERNKIADKEQKKKRQQGIYIPVPDSNLI